MNPRIKPSFEHVIELQIMHMIYQNDQEKIIYIMEA